MSRCAPVRPPAGAQARCSEPAALRGRDAPAQASSVDRWRPRRPALGSRPRRRADAIRTACAHGRRDHAARLATREVTSCCEVQASPQSCWMRSAVSWAEPPRPHRRPGRFPARPMAVARPLPTRLPEVWPRADDDGHLALTRRSSGSRLLQSDAGWRGLLLDLPSPRPCRVAQGVPGPPDLRYTTTPPRPSRPPWRNQCRMC